MKTESSNHQDSHPTEAMLVLALDHELDPREAAEIARHVELCAPCRGRWEQFSRVSERIVAFHDALQSRKHRQEYSCHTKPVPVVKFSRRYVGAAAAALAVAGWFAVQVYRHSPALRQTAVGPRVDEVKRITDAPAREALPVAKRSRPRRRPAGRESAEMASFIALPFSNSALPLADATVVRVELAIDELRLTGMTIDGDRSGTLVQADVLMGIDGLPRGIRFVQ
jgi:hypothetical protein